MTYNAVESHRSDKQLRTIAPAPPLPPRAQFHEINWINETPDREKACILRDFLAGQPDYNIRIFVLRHIVSRITFLPYHVIGILGFLLVLFLNVYNARTQLCRAFGTDSQFICVLSGSNPYRLEDKEQKPFDMEDLYRSLSILRVVAIVEGILVFSFAFCSCFIGIILVYVDWKRHNRADFKWDAYRHERFLWWAVRWASILTIASQFSLLSGLAGLALVKTEPLRLGKRLIRRYPRIWGIESKRKGMLAASIFVLIFCGCIIIGILALWAKLELARVGITLPPTLGINPRTGTWEPWTFSQVVILLGLANNIAGLFAMGAPSKITSLIEYRINPKQFAGALLQEHGFIKAAAIWFAVDRREVRKRLREVFLQLVPDVL